MMATTRSPRSDEAPPSGNRPAPTAAMITRQFHHCEGCDAQSSFKGGVCQMCELRGGPIERPAG